MSDPRRPEPVLHWPERMRERLGTAREAAAVRRRTAVPVAAAATDRLGVDAIARGPQPRRPGVFGLLMAIGSAMIALGGLWAWQAWSNRSAQPIDDLLPILAVGTDAGSDGLVPSDDSIATPPAVDGSPEASANPPAGAVDRPAAEQEQLTAASAEMIVHVSGAVTSPGVVVVAAGARVFEVIDLAGGVTRRADLDRVNLAAPVFDGERVHVPAEGEDVPVVVSATARPATAAGAAAADPLIDINSASESELEELPGVGPATARAIVQTREERGPFLNLDELLEVPGIGEAKLAQLRPFAVVGS